MWKWKQVFGHFLWRPIIVSSGKWIISSMNRISFNYLWDKKKRLRLFFCVFRLSWNQIHSYSVELYERRLAIWQQPKKCICAVYCNNLWQVVWHQGNFVQREHFFTSSESNRGEEKTSRKLVPNAPYITESLLFILSGKGKIQKKRVTL